jgi:hypothetical protein
LGYDLLAKEANALEALFRVHPRIIDPEEHVLGAELLPVAIYLLYHIPRVSHDDALLL